METEKREKVRIGNLEGGLAGDVVPVPAEYRIGLKLVQLVMGLIVLELLFVSVYAYWTTPTPAMVMSLLKEDITPGGGQALHYGQALHAYGDLRTAWTREIKDLAQLLLGLLGPLLGTILGYMFGRRGNTGGGDDD